MTLLLPLPTQMRSHSLLTGVAPSSAAPASSSSIFAVAAAFPSSQLHIPKSSSSSSSSSSLSSFYTTLKLQRTSFLGAWRPSHNKKHGSDNKKQQQQLKMAKSYMEQPKNPFFEFLSKVQGGLPVVGLLSRILSDEGGIGGDRIQFVEFCGRVEKACSSEASRTFFAFQERHGTVARPQYVLIWCWVAAVGAGLLKSEEIMLAALRLRVSYDIQYEIESFNLLMDTAAKRKHSTFRV
ncbi:hypothetical protein O6H91_18G064500 [Diphasiastrum complanatum]|uniref:Uncharacterized protein n=1 Tax=Diphasiastrum complanatum TaxID=34168 RepID=A0ACC2B203_DIPCM|nr:hypothetical protein O6H91_18G064500 [Diphasiastrum complanatum]